ncbi:MAG: FAD binding domain-containing protein [Gammaproteobacteria bacterium]
MSLTKLQGFYLPENGHAVVDLLGKFPDSALIVAGGTFVHGLIARGLLTEIEVLIDIQRLDLAYIKAEAAALRIGATTTFAQLQAAPEMQSPPLLGAVRDALYYPPVQVKNSATVGGCVAASCPFFDLPVSFLALNGIAKCQGPDGFREIHLDEFFPGLFENALNADEFMTELLLPLPSEKSASAFLKLETNANDLAILNAAVCVTIDKSGNCTAARVVVGGGVGEVPVRAISAEGVLMGQKLNDALCARAGQAARSGVQPMTDHRASSEYRTAMTEVLVERALKQAVNRLD